MPRSFSYPPPIMDKATLAWHLSVSESTIDNRVRDGLLPPGKLWGGKLVWMWDDVVEKVRASLGVQPGEAELAAEIRHATRKAINAR